jgi:hypothetical protein
MVDQVIAIYDEWVKRKWDLGSSQGLKRLTKSTFD